MTKSFSALRPNIWPHLAWRPNFWLLLGSRPILIHIDLKAKILTSASMSYLCPWPHPWPFGLNLGLKAKMLASLGLKTRILKIVYKMMFLWLFCRKFAIVKTLQKRSRIHKKWRWVWFKFWRSVCCARNWWRSSVLWISEGKTRTELEFRVLNYTVSYIVFCGGKYCSELHPFNGLFSRTTW